MEQNDWMQDVYDRLVHIEAKEDGIVDCLKKITEKKQYKYL